MGWRWQPDPSKAYGAFNDGSYETVVPYGWVWLDGVASEGYWSLNEGSNVYTPPPPDPTGRIVATTELNEGTAGATTYVDTGAGVAQTYTAQQFEAQRKADFVERMQRPGATWWDKALAIQDYAGIEALASLAASGVYFPPEFAAELGPHIAARQREAEGEGFTIGGNQIGLWPVVLGMAAFAWFAASAATTAGSGAAAAEGGAAATVTEGGAAIGAEVAVVEGAELAALVESGTVGLEGAGLEAAAITGGSVTYSTTTGALLEVTLGATGSVETALEFDPPSQPPATQPPAQPSLPDGVQKVLGNIGKALQGALTGKLVSGLFAKDAPAPAPRSSAPSRAGADGEAELPIPVLVAGALLVAFLVAR